MLPDQHSRAAPLTSAIAVLALLIAFAAAPGQAAMLPVSLAKTGQTSCFNGSGTVIDCTRTGQDGELQAGYAWPKPRFTDNGNQTRTDLLTGLAWTRDADPAGEYTTWEQALALIRSLNRRNHLGHSDWRLPNLSELESLANAQFDPGGWLFAQGFVKIRGDYYWTSTTYASYPRYAWSLSLYGGMVAGRNKLDVAYVWPVRTGTSRTDHPAKTGQTLCYDTAGTIISCGETGQDGALRTGVAWPDPRFTASGDHALADRLTGLVWSKDARTPGPPACTPGTPKTQNEALEHIKCLNAQQFMDKSDWRLPNRNELASLVNRGQPNSADWLNSLGFRHVAPFSYWSSTSYPPAPGNAWCVIMHDGAVLPVTKKVEAYVWPVRSEPVTDHREAGE